MGLSAMRFYAKLVCNFENVTRILRVIGENLWNKMALILKSVNLAVGVLDGTQTRFSASLFYNIGFEPSQQRKNPRTYKSI